MFAGFEEMYTRDKMGLDQILYGIRFEDRYNLNGLKYKYSYKIIPQYCLTISYQNYRVDFAIICKSYEDDNLKKEVKLHRV